MKNKTIGGNMAASLETTISSPVVSQKANQNTAVPSHGNGSPCEKANTTAAQPQNPSHGSDPAVPRQVLDQIIAQVARAPEAPVAEPLVTKTDLAKHFRVSERTVQRWIGNDMPFVWVGRIQKRFRLSQVQLWLQQNHIDRFAAQGIATTMTEVRRRIVNIPILNGLEILQSPPPPKGATNAAQGNALRPTTANVHALKGQTNSGFTPRCQAGRKKAKPSPTVPCDGSHHKWRTSRYTRTCAVCGTTQDRDPHDNWIEST